MATLNGYSDFLAKLVQDYVLVSGTTWTPSTADLYVGLSTAPIQSDGTGWAEPSITGTAYNREPSDGLWGSAAIAATTPTTVIQSTNSVDEIVFPTAIASWGTVVAAGVLGSPFPIIPPAVPADLYFGGNLASPKTIEIDTSPVFLTNSFKVSTSNTP